MTLAYLVQHGEKEPSPGDPGLTHLGRDQAARTGRWLGVQGVRALYSSPLRRARETADCIAPVTALVVQPDARLRAARVTCDLLRDLLGDGPVTLHLLDAGIPPCAVTGVEHMNVVMIASTSHLV